MSSPSATSEDHATLWYEQAIHASTHVGAMAFGILIAIYYLAMYYSLRSGKLSWGWIVFNTALVVMGAINIATNIHFNETAWIDERNYPGGPYAFLVEQQSRPVQTIGNSASVIASTMAEGLLLYRVFVVWKNHWYIVILPSLLFLACTALSIITVAHNALPFSPAWMHIPSFGFPVWIMLMVLNVTLTFLLAARMLYLRQSIRSTMGHQYGRTYTNVAAMVVESALPFGILSIVFLVLFGKKDPSQNLLLPLLVQVECISPMLIILRVIRGSAWTTKTAPQAPLSTLEFASGEPSSMSKGMRTSRSIIGTSNPSDHAFKHHSGSEMDEEANGSGSVIRIV